MKKAIRNHRNYNEDDYVYLAAKGWSDEEILRRWDEESAKGKGPCRWDHHIAQSKLRATLRA